MVRLIGHRNRDDARGITLIFDTLSGGGLPALVAQAAQHWSIDLSNISACDVPVCLENGAEVVSADHLDKDDHIYFDFVGYDSADAPKTADALTGRGHHTARQSERCGPAR